MTTITASHPVVSLPSLELSDHIEITVQVRVSFKTVKVIIPLSDDDRNTFRFLEGGDSSILERFIHSVVSTWLSHSISYKCNVVDFRISGDVEFSQGSPVYPNVLYSYRTHELPPLSSEPVRYNLHTVDIVEEDGMPSYTLEYLCDDADWAHAVIHFHHGRHLGCDVSLNNKRYYPGIENDYPNAKIIPSMRKETREDIIGLR